MCTRVMRAAAVVGPGVAKSDFLQAIQYLRYKTGC
jgi:hypothetical protein